MFVKRSVGDDIKRECAWESKLRNFKGRFFCCFFMPKIWIER